MEHIAVEPYSDQLVEEIKPLIQMHYDEIALHKEVIPLDPDWDRYAAIDSTGNLLIVTARTNEQELIGYAVFFITPHIHYKSTIVAHNDILYLHPEYRRGRTGIRLLKDSETACRHLGVDKILWHIKFAKDFRHILYRFGYCDEDAIVGKILREK
jgi:GNAT superfamily N-acetyltransferase